MKLRSKFMVCFLAFALIPILIIGTINYFQTRLSNINSAFDTLRAQENLSKISIQDKINTIAAMGKKDSSNTIIRNYMKTINNSKKDDTLKNNIKDGFKSTKEDFSYYANIALTDKNGKCTVDASGILENMDLAKNDYFIKAKEDSKTYISSVKKSQSTGNPVIVISEPIFVDNQFQGVLLQSIDLTNMSQNLINSISIGKTGGVFVVENDGTMIIHKDKGEIFNKNFLNVNAANKILKDKKGTIEYTYKGEDKLAAYDYDSNLGWIFVATIGKSELMGTSNTVLKTTVILSLIAIISSILLSLIITKRLSAPIIKVSEAMNRLSEGDFTINVHSESKDEIGHMSRKLDNTIKSVRGSVAEVKNTSVSIGEDINILSKNSSEMVTSVNEVSNAIQDVAAGSTSQAEDLMDVVNMVSDFTKELEETNNRLVKVNCEIKDSEEKAKQGSEEINLLIQNICEVKEKFDAVLEKVNNLSGSVSQIGSITDVINDISEKTNLLALNAAIEAARAGEHGKGFAVVAEEVRKLAEQSKDSSHEIIQLVKSIYSETNEVKSTSSGVGDVLESQAESANNTIIILYDIIDAVKDISSLMNEANDSLGSVMENKKSILDKVQNVSAVAEEVSASSEEIAASSEEMLAGAEEVNNHAERVRHSASDLTDKVKKFIV
ncbi:methyl-accepting chemotaxis protein [Clostridium pasteurianum]|uniref:methyl-accepting chemotaxis protein n=1 Tax=Clostridium pasteurianum TaxID=1501 RepID=UPI002260AD20|nr:methyl-accepting chemotaxis protein [Clostridium pasteurianum]UZW14503.1 methyl-accepting chemotaxis protein [Clostridium pasteurianum]